MRTTTDGRGGCACCGQSGAVGRCSNEWCHRMDRGWSVIYSAGIYQGSLRRAVVDYKYRGLRHRGAVLADGVARYVTGRPTWFEEYDFITAVPSYRGPDARRDWDPVGELLAQLAKRLGTSWEIRTDVMAKTSETPPMSGRSRFERGRIAEGALRAALVAGPSPVCGARILVLDDVFTEGSTLREVARVLLAAGAEEVAGLVVARPSWQLRRPGGAMSRTVPPVRAVVV